MCRACHRTERARGSCRTKTRFQGDKPPNNGDNPRKSCCVSRVLRVVLGKSSVIASRKSGGCYSYYVFMQNRSFDIAGPNPTKEEQKHIDEQYTVFLDKQRRSFIAASLAAKQEQQTAERPEKAALPVVAEAAPAKPKAT